MASSTCHENNAIPEQSFQVNDFSHIKTSINIALWRPPIM